MPKKERDILNITQLLSDGYNILKENGIESYMIDTQLLLQQVLNVDKLFILTNRNKEISEFDKEVFYNLLETRRKKRPMKYILGHSEFMGLDFLVREGVLIPRPDTEILVEKVIEIVKLQNLKNICDVCCGSGAIGISLAHYLKESQFWACDLSETACEVTEENAKRLLPEAKLKIHKSDLLDFAIEKGLSFDLIVSNPPYIREAVIETLMEDVKNYEPHMALSGGEDGLVFYRKIIAQSLKVLNPKGFLAFEIGHDQGREVREIMEAKGYKNVEVYKDYAGLDRVVIGKI